MNDKGRTVYSTRTGQHCPDCGRPTGSCSCRGKAKPGKTKPAEVARQVPDDGIVRVGRETKGRKGAGVTVVTGLRLPQDQLQALARRLKQACGSGGTVRDGVIEVQGEQRDRIVRELESLGYRVKRVGG